MKGYVCAIWVLMTFTYPVFAQDMGRLTVVGNGQSASTPDMATISLGVNSQARTAAQALTSNSNAMAQVISVVEGAGIETKFIQTSGLSLSPRWNNRSSDNNSPPAIVGFSVQNQVTIRVLDLGILGGLLDQVIANGANQFHGLQFGLQDPQPALDQARTDAVADAMRKAKLYADAAGIKLGPVLSLSESSVGSQGPVMVREMAMSSDVPIAQGEIGTNANVTVQFEILP